MPRRKSHKPQTLWKKLHQFSQKHHLVLLEGVFFFAWLSLAAVLWFAQANLFQIPVLPQVLGSESSITGQSIHQAVNEQRAKNNVRELQWSDQLAQAAQGKAQDMIAHDYWAHTSPDGKQPWTFIDATGYSYRVAGENLARNFSSSSSVVRAWLDSPTHRANMLQPVYQETGVAAVTGKMNGKETVLVVQMFGAPGGSARGTSESSPGGSVGAPIPIAPPPGEISPSAPNISRWLAPTAPETNGTNPSTPEILGLAGPAQPLMWYRLGMVAVLLGAITLLILDAHHPRHRKTHNKHPLFRPSKHAVHILLLIGALFTLAVAEVGALL